MAIDFSLLQPVDIGGQFLAGLQAGQQARMQREQQQQAIARAQKMQQDVAAWQSDMSPERTAQLLLSYPEIKDQLTSAQSVLSDAAKRDRLDFASRALMLSRAGQKDQVKAMAQQRIDALRNSGKTKEAAEAKAMLKAWEIDPRVGEGALALDVAAADPKLYETLFGKTEMTSFQKDLMAAGIDPNSPEGQTKAAEYVALKTDPIVQMPTPTGGQFIGRQSEYYRMFGGGESNAPAPNKLPSPLTKQQYDALPPGTEYFDPRDNKVKRKGGSNPLAGVPAPQLDASGKPTSLTQAQYQAVVQVKGKAKTDAWLQANNITVSDR